MGKQEEVDIFMNSFNLDIKPEYRLLDVVAELGEVCNQVLSQTSYGEEDFLRSKHLEEEIGDLYFSLIALANRLNIDLDLCLEKVMEKYEKRIKENGDPGSKRV